MKTMIVTLEDIIEYYVMGSRLTGFAEIDGKTHVKIYHQNGEKINHINIDKDDKTALIIDHKVKFHLDHIVGDNGSTIKVTKILATDNTRRKMFIFTEITDDSKVEDNAVDVLLITRVLCALANKKINLVMNRYRNKDDYQLPVVGCSVVIGKDFENMPRPEHPESTNALYVPKEYDGSIKELVKTLKGLLKIDKNISYLRVYEVYKEYKQGKLTSKNFELWGMAYNKFYQLDPDKTPLYQLEMMANDYNTKVIVSYLVSRYKMDYYKKKNLVMPLEVTHTFHPDVAYAVGSNKYKADLFYSRIKRNYVNSIFVQNVDSKPAYSYMLDINGLLSEEEMKKYIDLLVYVINFVKEEDKIKIVVNFTKKHEGGMIACFNSTPILKILENNFMLKSTTVEFNPIR